MSEAESHGSVSGVIAVSLDGKGGASPISPSAAVAASADTPVWINIDFSDPHAAEWAWNESGLDDSIVGAMLDTESRPRTLQQGNGVLTMLRGVNLNPGARLEDMISVRTWLEPGRVVTASRRCLRSLTEIRQNIEQGKGPPTPSQLLIDLIDRLNHYIGEGIEQIEEHIDRAEDEAAHDSSLNRSSSFNQLRRQTAQIRRYLSPQREALERLARVTESVFDGEEMIELREQLNRLTLGLEDLDLVRERALVAQEEFLSLLAHEQNSRMLVLSIVAAIFLPLSFLTGLMGMNVAGLPGTVNAGSFWIIVLLMVLIAVGILAIFRNRKWL
ncbi:zinc transporter ZntB [Pseudomonadota bacterium]|jgi:zinc transporter|nr:zinc transporter ZntB [Xanthomonadales bacterium]